MDIEQIKLLHEETQGQDRELFIKQVMFFRKVMCSTKYTLEQKEIAFEHLAEAYLRCNLNQSDIDLFVMTSEEFERRSLYELFHPKNNIVLEAER